MKIGKNISKDEKKLVNKMFLRSSTMFCSAQPVTMGGGGFAYSILPFINKFYDNDKDKAEALSRNVRYFNTTVPLSSFIMGITASMEKQNSQSDDFDVESINAIKTSLMGPLAGIGDSIFWGVWRVVCAGLAISLAKAGNVFAPLLFFFLFNIPSWAVRYYGGVLGYSLGSKYIEKIYNNGLIEILTKAASVLGLIMVGAMTISMVGFKSKLVLTMDGTQVLNLQKVLDELFKGLIPLIVTLVCYSLLKKKKISVIGLIFVIMGLGVVLSFLGIV